MNRGVTFMAILGLLWLGGCRQSEEDSLLHGGSDVGNPLDPTATDESGFPVSSSGYDFDQTALKILGVSSNNLTAALLLDQGIEIDEARVVLRHVRFHECLDDPEVDEEESAMIQEQIEDFLVVNLLSGGTAPDLSSFELQSGVFCRVQAMIFPLSAEDRPEGMSETDGLIDRSLVLNGRSSLGTPFQVRINVMDQFMLEPTLESFIIEPSDHLFMAFDLDRWLEGVDLDSLEKVNGAVVIDQNQNIRARNTIRQNVKASVRMVRDRDKDNDLNLGEFELEEALTSVEDREAE